LSELFDAAVAIDPSKIALIQVKEENQFQNFTYGDVAHLVQQFQSELQGLNVMIYNLCFSSLLTMIYFQSFKIDTRLFSAHLLQIIFLRSWCTFYFGFF